MLVSPCKRGRHIYHASPESSQLHCCHKESKINYVNKSIRFIKKHQISFIGFYLHYKVNWPISHNRVVLILLNSLCMFRVAPCVGLGVKATNIVNTVIKMIVTCRHVSLNMLFMPKQGTQSQVLHSLTECMTDYTSVIDMDIRSFLEVPCWQPLVRALTENLLFC